MQTEELPPAANIIIFFFILFCFCPALDVRVVLANLCFYSFMIAANGFQALKYSHLTSLSVIIVCSHTKIMIISLHAKLFYSGSLRTVQPDLQSGWLLPGGLQSAGTAYNIPDRS